MTATPESVSGNATPENNNAKVPVWEQMLAWLFRLAIFVTAIYYVWSREWLYFCACVFSIALVMSVPLYARSMHANLPLELELVLLWWLVGDMTLGQMANLYDTSAWFDKALHFVNPLLLSWMAFLALYALHATGRLRVSSFLLVMATVLLTLGLGAAWEIGEYISDLLFGMGAQGSPDMSPLDDTMVDLIFDAIGGFFGGSIGALYVYYSHRSHSRIRAISRLIP